MSSNYIEQFVTILRGLSPNEIIGLAKVLNVNVLTDGIDKETRKAIPKDGALILSDIINAFTRLSRHRRRELVHLLQKIGGKH